MTTQNNRLERAEPEEGGPEFHAGKKLKWMFPDGEETNQFPHAVNKILIYGGKQLISKVDKRTAFIYWFEYTVSVFFFSVET